jgi:hypothetical protein
LEFLIVIFLCLLLWLLYLLFVQWPEEKRQSNLREQKRAEFLSSALSGTPKHILIATRDGEVAYRFSPSNYFGQEFSPLVYYGYRTGVTKGRTERERREILQHCLAVEFPDFFPPSYRNSWGKPASRTRFRRITKHIEGQVALKEGVGNAPVAVQEWNDDLDWLNENFRWMAK